MRHFISCSLLSVGLLAGACNRAASEQSSMPPPSDTKSFSSTTLEKTPATDPGALGQASEPKAPSHETSAGEQVSGQTGTSDAAANASAENVPPTRKLDVVYVPTPQLIVDKMLELAKPKKTEVVYDLGCGDGRIVVTAAKKYGTRAHGFDIDPERVAEARENVRKNNLEALVTIEQKDIFTLDLSPADVVTLYLLPRLNVRLIPQLQKLKPGARIVSHDFDMHGVTPLKHLTLKPTPDGRDHEIYLWRAPIRPDAEVAGRAP